MITHVKFDIVIIHGHAHPHAHQFVFFKQPEDYGCTLQFEDHNMELLASFGNKEGKRLGKLDAENRTKSEVRTKRKKCGVVGITRTSPEFEDYTSVCNCSLFHGSRGPSHTRILGKVEDHQLTESSL